MDIYYLILMGCLCFGTCFSSDEKFLVVNRSSGPSRVWDLKSSEAVANLPREQVSDFFVCQFALVYFLCLKCTSDSYISREKYLASADFLLSLTIVRFSLLQQCKVTSRFEFNLLWMKYFEVILKNEQNCLLNLRPDSYNTLLLRWLRENNILEYHQMDKNWIKESNSWCDFSLFSLAWWYTSSNVSKELWISH